jgi:hypothetical protein
MQLCIRGDLAMAGDTKENAIVGTYGSGILAERAVDVLVRAGFRSGAVSVLWPDHENARIFGQRKEAEVLEDAAAGTAAGDLTGGSVGVLAGIGSIALSGIGPFVSMAPMRAGSSATGGAEAPGGFPGVLDTLGIPEYEARRYVSYLGNGEVLLSVHCRSVDEISRAREILRVTGAGNIAIVGETSGGENTTAACRTG